MSIELVVATTLGGALGQWADTTWSTTPWLTLVGVLAGLAAGIRNMLRLSSQLTPGPGGNGPDGVGKADAESKE